MSDRDFSEDDPKPDWRYEPKHANYARPSGKPRALGAGPTRHVLTIARADRRLADAAPEVQPKRITGRYQNAGAAGEAGRPAFLLHVNQAGKHIQALLVDLSHQSGPAKYYRLWGDLRGGEFEILDSNINTGSIKIDGLDLLVSYEAVPLNGERFHLRELRPSFFDDSLESLIEIYGDIGGDIRAAKKMLEEAERTPLTDAQMKAILEAFSSEQIEPFLKTFHEHAESLTTADHAQAIFTAASLDDYVGKAFKGDGWHRQLETAREYTRRTLAFQKASFDHSRKSLLQWIEDLTVEAIGFLPEIGSSTELRPMTNLRKLIGLEAGGDLTRYEYRLALDLKHKGLKVLGTLKGELYYGTMSVSSPIAPSFRSLPHEHVYNVVLVGGGLLLSKGKGGEADIKGHAYFSSLGEWTPADFPGALKLLEGGVWVGKKALGMRIGGGKRDAALTLNGRRNHPAIVAALEGLDSFRDGIGAEFDFSIGYVLQKGEDLDSKDFSRQKKRVDYTMNKKDKQEAHFDLGSALLKGSGRHAVRVCAATWLAWLDSEQSFLEIVGQADTVDEHLPGRNLELSILRAKNVKQALIDILGGDLRIPEKQIRIAGLGDAEAATVYHSHEIPDEKYRRVDIRLNGRCVLVLWSA